MSRNSSCGRFARISRERRRAVAVLADHAQIALRLAELAQRAAPGLLVVDDDDVHHAAGCGRRRRRDVAPVAANREFPAA